MKKLYLMYRRVCLYKHKKNKDFPLNNAASAALFLGAVVFIIVMFCLYFTGYLGLWTRGIAYIAESPKYKLSNHILSNEVYVVEINLQDLSDNKNKIVYDDGTCKIVVKAVERLTDDNGYGIFFDSVGAYSIEGAKLVSGIQYSCENKDAYSANVNVTMEAIYNKSTQLLPVSGITPLNYRNGDSFGFYILPIGEKFDIRKADKVTLALKNLCVNVWQ